MDENNNFLDKNTVMAIALSVLFFVGWQAYIQKQYPDSKKTTVEKKLSNNNQASGVLEIPNKLKDEKNIEQPQKEQNAEKTVETFTVESENWKVLLISKGMGLSSVELKQFSDRQEKNIQFC